MNLNEIKNRAIPLKNGELPRRILFRVLIVVLIVSSVFAGERKSSFEKTGQSEEMRKGASRKKPNRMLPIFTPPSEKFDLSGEHSIDNITSKRIFSEPLIPIGGKPTTQDNRSLVLALNEHLKRPLNDDFTALQSFLALNPNSKWRASLLTCLGGEYYRTGYFSRALASWESAWKLLKQAKDPRGKAIGDYTLGELAKMYARLGRHESLNSLFEEVGDREVLGPATEKMTGAKEGLWVMENEPHRAFLCGPIALQSILISQGKLGGNETGELLKVKSGKDGISLWTVDSIARSLKMNLRMAKWTTASHVPVPSVVHWKAGHFAALVKWENGKYLMKDPTFGDELWISEAAVADEASGNFLVPRNDSVKSWMDVESTVAKATFGKGFTTQNDPNATKETDTKIKKFEPCKGMASYDIHAMVVSLNIVDVPVGYAPPRGMDVRFRVTYNQREANQPAIFTYSNLGPKWTFDWISYVIDRPDALAGNVSVFARGGGKEEYFGFNSGLSASIPEIQSQAQLVRTSLSPVRYEKRLPNGAVEVFSLVATGSPRRVFLTQIIDPNGNNLTFTYDSQYRLVAVTDALGQVSILAYTHQTDPLKVTRVTDPFGRFADFEYDELGRLVKITDVIGMASQFSYSGDFIHTMTTPYGATTFSKGESGTTRWLEVTNPIGGKERVEFRNQAPGIPDRAPDPVPTGMSTFAYNHARNTFYWDDRTLREHGTDYTKAKIYHWQHSSLNGATGVTLESVKNPLENRIFYEYANSGGPAFMSNNMQGKPAKIGRVLDDGTSQVYKFEYNSFGLVTKSVDPSGRTTNYQYASNNIDLLNVRQVRGLVSDVLATMTYDGNHNVLTYVDVSGKTHTYTYNPAGQLTTSTDPADRTVTLTYDPNGYLIRVRKFTAGNDFELEYDDFGRVGLVRTPEGYTVRTEYDALDRATKRIYPDGTYDEVVYDKLDLAKIRDRRGRWSKATYNGIRQLVSVQDPLGRVSAMSWCTCGDMEKFTDPMGRTTFWERDLQGRVIFKALPDGSRETFKYESTTSRLRSVTDALGQITQFEYYVDDLIKKVSYSNAVHTTPAVEYEYDSFYPRLSKLKDGIGITEFSYHTISSPPVHGSGAVSRIDGPFPDDNIDFTYNALGDIASNAINGVLATTGYDGLGRIQTIGNALGTFVYSYEGFMPRVTSVEYPNQLETILSYFGPQNDFRLLTIENTGSTGLVSKFEYSYDPVGIVKTWTTTHSGTQPHIMKYRMDAADQLLSAVERAVGAGSPIIRQFSYAYDRAGNRTSVQVGRKVDKTTFNALNQITGVSGGGSMRFEGTVNEPANVSIAGKRAPQTTDLTFSGTTSVVPGSNNVEIRAVDLNSNVSSKTYTVNVDASSPLAFTYDANGNLLSDGNQTYGWDAANRLVWIQNGNDRTEFDYDGLGRRVVIREIVAGSIVSQKKFVWIGMDVAEERNTDGATVTKRFFPQGVQVGTEKYFYTKDHLGSIREVTDMTGVVRARYDYSPFGERVRISGDFDSDFGFTGHFYHEKSGLHLTMYRAYSARLGRWLSKDPIGFYGNSVNLYAYVGNNPVNYIDPDGLVPIAPMVIGGLVGGGWATVDNFKKYADGEISGWNYTGRIAFGIGTGIASSFGGAFWGTVARGTWTSAANNAFGQLTDECDPDFSFSDVGKAGATGALISASAFTFAKAGAEILVPLPQKPRTSLSTYELPKSWRQPRVSVEIPLGTVGDVGSGILIKMTEE